MTKVTVKLKNLSHTWGNDVDVLLVGPGGQKMRLMENAGTGTTTNSTLTFSDTAAGTLPQTGRTAQRDLQADRLHSGHHVSGTGARGSVWDDPGGFQRDGCQRNVVVVCV